MTELTSVVIPSRDRPGLVARAVASVLNQGTPLEVIVVDDGSDPALVREGPLGDPCVKILRNAVSEGPATARNLGLRASTGDFVAFLDDDDLWLPGKLQRCLQVANAFPEAKVVVHRTSFQLPGKEVAPSEVLFLPNPLRQYGTTQTPHVDGVMVRGSLAKEVEFDQAFDAAQDVDYVLQLARRSAFVLIDDVLAVHGTRCSPSLVSLERRIAARQRLCQKHGDILYATRLSRSFYHVRLAHLHRRQGDRRKAVQGFLTALWHHPLSGLGWRGLATTVLSSFGVWSLGFERGGGQ